MRINSHVPALALGSALAACGNGIIPAASSAGHDGVGDAGSVCSNDGGAPCSRSLSIVFGGLSRSYVLHIPPHYQAGTTPLVIFLHGTGSSAAYSESSTDLDATADQEGFAIAYANAAVSDPSLPVWSVYFSDAAPTAPDDVGFIRALIGTLAVSIAPDPKRIYLTGLSIGAAMAERIGVELSNLIAAIASVEGTIKIDYRSALTVPADVSPVSVLLLHADTANEMVPYCGGPNAQYGNWSFASQETTFDYWSGPSANACATFSPSTPLCDDHGAITSVTSKVATSCKNGAEVRLYRIGGGAHAWWPTPLNDPNSPPYNPDLNVSTGVTTNEIVWKFFAAHRKP